MPKSHYFISRGTCSLIGEVNGSSIDFPVTQFSPHRRKQMEMTVMVMILIVLIVYLAKRR